MIRIGLVGTGGMGTVHYSNYQHIPGCEVAAVVGVTEQSRECALRWGLPLYDSISAMVTSETIDAIDICTPTYLHKDHVLESLANGKHTITEKPIALHSQDARQMYAEADRQNCQLYVAQVLQFTREVEILRHLVRSGEYGKPLDACFERLSASPRWSQGGWLFDREKSGLLPFDLHIHDLDVIVSLFGRPQDARFTSCGRDDQSHQDQYRFHYTFPGLNVTAEAAWFNADIPFTARWRVYFENAMLIHDGTRLTAYQTDRAPYVYDTQDEPLISTGINLPPTGMFFHELTHFVNCIEQGIPSEKVTRGQVLTVVGLLEEMTREN